jgi:hypothetical protein
MKNILFCSTYTPYISRNLFLSSLYHTLCPFFRCYSLLWVECDQDRFEIQSYPTHTEIRLYCPVFPTEQILYSWVILLHPSFLHACSYSPIWLCSIEKMYHRLRIPVLLALETDDVDQKTNFIPYRIVGTGKESNQHNYPIVSLSTLFSSLSLPRVSPRYSFSFLPSSFSLTDQFDTSQGIGFSSLESFHSLFQTASFVQFPSPLCPHTFRYLYEYTLSRSIPCSPSVSPFPLSSTSLVQLLHSSPKICLVVPFGDCELGRLARLLVERLQNVCIFSYDVPVPCFDQSPSFPYQYQPLVWNSFSFPIYYSSSSCSSLSISELLPFLFEHDVSTVLTMEPLSIVSSLSSYSITTILLSSHVSSTYYDRCLSFRPSSSQLFFPFSLPIHPNSICKSSVLTFLYIEDVDYDTLHSEWMEWICQSFLTCIQKEKICKCKVNFIVQDVSKWEKYHSYPFFSFRPMSLYDSWYTETHVCICSRQIDRLFLAYSHLIPCLVPSEYSDLLPFGRKEELSFTPFSTSFSSQLSLFMKRHHSSRKFFSSLRSSLSSWLSSYQSTIHEQDLLF